MVPPRLSRLGVRRPGRSPPPSPPYHGEKFRRQREERQPVRMAWRERPPRGRPRSCHPPQPAHQRKGLRLLHTIAADVEACSRWQARCAGSGARARRPGRPAVVPVGETEIDHAAGGARVLAGCLLFEYYRASRAALLCGGRGGDRKGPRGNRALQPSAVDGGTPSPLRGPSTSGSTPVLAPIAKRSSAGPRGTRAGRSHRSPVWKASTAEAEPPLAPPVRSREGDGRAPSFELRRKPSRCPAAAGSPVSSTSVFRVRESPTRRSTALMAADPTWSGPRRPRAAGARGGVGGWSAVPWLTNEGRSPTCPRPHRANVRRR